MYQLVLNFPGGVPQVVKRLADNVFIPFDPANTDYQQFLRWCEEGNQPLPADDNGQAAE
jgi:hypothetical protein